VVLRALSLRSVGDLSRAEMPKSNTILARFIRDAHRLKAAPKRLAYLAERTHRDLEFMRGFITTLVAVAPLLGLLGTVIGMVEMFGSMQGAKLNAGESTVAGGISTALVTTQLGLVIAAPGFVASYLLTRQQRRRELDIQYILSALHGSSS